MNKDNTTDFGNKKNTAKQGVSPIYTQEDHLRKFLGKQTFDLVIQRKTTCHTCDQAKAIHELSVECKACGCSGNSLINGRCKFRKWNN